MSALERKTGKLFFQSKFNNIPHKVSQFKKKKCYCINDCYDYYTQTDNDVII